MSERLPSRNWKLELRYGRLLTPYKHFTALAEGIVGQCQEGLDCRPGAAFMAVKTWASDVDESARMLESIGRQIGFSATGRIQIYETEPEQPPRDNPYGYDIRFVPYDDDES